MDRDETIDLLASMLSDAGKCIVGFGVVAIWAVIIAALV